MNIHDIALPGGHFADAASLREFRPEARAYEAIIAADLDEADLWPALAALGFDRREIQWHVDNPGTRMRQGYL
jgi:hypothetical protein